MKKIEGQPNSKIAGCLGNCAGCPLAEACGKVRARSVSTIKFPTGSLLNISLPKKSVSISKGRGGGERGISFNERSCEKCGRSYNSSSNFGCLHCNKKVSQAA